MIGNPGNQYYVIIVAGGIGSRMNSAIPKQFLLLAGKPVLMHTIENFYHSAFNPSVIVVLPEIYHHYWAELCERHAFNVPLTLIKGGDTRFDSVKNALVEIPDYENVFIAIQDAVRPLTSKKIIDASFNLAATNGNAVAAVQSRDSVRLFSQGVSQSLPRNSIYLVQTPQVFNALQIKKAYEQTYRAEFTDDASVVETAGFKINITEGDYTNIKVTYPEDLYFAELVIKKGYNGF